MSRILAMAVTMTAMVAAAQSSAPVATGAGNQTDPHISGSVVAYTDDASGTTRISYTAIGGSPSTIPAHSGDSDSLSDISGSTIAFVRSNDDTGSNIYTFTIGGAAATAVDPVGGGERSNAAVGGNVVAFEELGNVRAYDLSTNSYVFTTAGSSAAVSAGGTAVAYVSGGTVYQRTSAGGWAAAAISAGTDPDTNGTTVAYVEGGDIAWTDSSGESTLTFAGTDSNPNISGNLVAFEHQSGGQTDLYLVDTGASSPSPIQLTNTPGVSETLNDIYVDGSTVRVVYVMNNTGNDDVHVVTYETGVAACDWPTTGDAATACDYLWDAADPTVDLVVVREDSKPSSTSASSTATGEGFICVRSKASTGAVRINNAQIVGPGEFSGANQKFSSAATLESGWSYSVSVGGSNGSTIQLRVFSKNDVCPVIAPGPSTTTDPLTSDEGGVGFGKKSDKQGCSATGGGNLVLFAALLMMLFISRRLPAASRVRSSRR